jgi:hypothetical protein
MAALFPHFSMPENFEGSAGNERWMPGSRERDHWNHVAGTIWFETKAVHAG